MTYDIDIDSYIGYPISKGYVRSKLEPRKGKPTTVRINSFGGSVADALDIRQQFLDHGDVTAYIFGMTASAATILAMGAKKIVMSKYALMLAHCCSGWVDTWGQMNAEELEVAIKELRAQQADLEKIDEVVANLYALRSGRSPEQMATVMAEARWLTAEECKNLGLIDEIIEEGEKPAVTAKVREHFAACGMPLPVIEEERPSLMTRVAQGVKNLLSPSGNIEDTAETTENINPQTPINKMDKNLFAALFAALGVESLTASEDGSVTLSREQAEAVNAALSKHTADAAAHAAEIDRLTGELTTAQAAQAALEEQVENLKKADGAETDDIEDGEGDETRAATADRLFKATAGLV